ncbi:MAG: cytochrome c maturation protein CcmE [Betaproteobacteria bacterium]|nr:cytochrome c maturation protein CcmE [Betaproteobacteria bacterium]NBS46608.1 cytochrome c maturation protein CcmE [Betaproteobacteria bacterium]
MKLFSPSRNRRLLVLLVGLGTLTVASALVLNAFNRNLVFFFSPSQVHAREAPHERNFRLGGLVATGSVQRDAASLRVDFVVTDGARSVPVRYSGLLPDLFREGKGVVAQGRLGVDGIFHADQVLAKHDENYMPPEAAAALKAAQQVAPAGPQVRP